MLPWNTTKWEFTGNSLYIMRSCEIFPTAWTNFWSVFNGTPPFTTDNTSKHAHIDTGSSYSCYPTRENKATHPLAYWSWPPFLHPTRCKRWTLNYNTSVVRHRNNGRLERPLNMVTVTISHPRKQWMPPRKWAELWWFLHFKRRKPAIH